MKYIKCNVATLWHQMIYCFKQKFFFKSADFYNDLCLESLSTSLTHYIPHV